jgi:pimeloyl-ACP methyl ester carboxylesterase
MILPYNEHGPKSGVPVLTLHGGIDGDAFEPLMGTLALREHRLIRYRRRAFVDPPIVSTRCSIGEEATDALRILDHALIESAHLVGHSYGALVAVEIARRRPDRVRSLALLETGLIREIPSAGRAAAVMVPIHRLYQEGKAEAALQAFAAIIFGADYVRAQAKRQSAADHRRKMADARGTFDGDLPSLDGWRFTEAVSDIRHPVLSLIGADSDATFLETLGFAAISEVRAMVAAHLPQSEHRVIAGVNHLLHVSAPEAVAEELVAFYRRIAR